MLTRRSKVLNLQTGYGSPNFVVDDDPDLLGLLQMHLSTAGYEVRTAEDAIQAGYTVLAQPPDLIITDVSMPHMDGFKLTKPVRADRLPALVAQHVAGGASPPG